MDSNSFLQQGAICHASLEASMLLTRYLDDDLCTPAGVDAINFGIARMKEQPVIPQILVNLDITEINFSRRCTPQYFTKVIEELVNKIFNRVLFLPLEMQTFFFFHVRESLKRYRQKEDFYNPLKGMMMGMKLFDFY